jgi:hypothetical protein
MLSPLTIRCCAPCSIGSARLGSDGRKDWAEVIADRRTGTTRLVRDQLEATGGLAVERRVLGMSSSPRLTGYEEASLRYLSDQVSQAVHNAIDGLPAPPRPLAAGLLAVVGQMPTVFTRAEWSRHRQRLRELTFAAIEANRRVALGNRPLSREQAARRARRLDVVTRDRPRLDT